MGTEQADVGSQLLTIGYLIELFLLKGHHLGFPMSFLTLDDMVAFLKVSSRGRRWLHNTKNQCADHRN